MTDSCLDCRERPQTGKYGRCDECRVARRERVWASIQDKQNATDDDHDDADDVADDRREQARLTEWSG